MIYAKLTDAGAYCGIHPRLDRALRLLTSDFPETVGTQTEYLEGSALYVTRFDYETLPREATFFEAHRRYLDIHLLLRGAERVELAHPDTLCLFEQGEDFFAFRGEAEQTVVLRPGSFLAVFPGDAHRIKIREGDAAQVSKVVFKILTLD